LRLLLAQVDHRGNVALHDCGRQRAASPTPARYFERTGPSRIGQMRSILVEASRSRRSHMSLPIEDYALLGDTRTAALVSKEGSIDWLCLPRFDSAACFAALLGDARHGRWSIAPARGAQRATRRYRDGTLVLETELATDTGVVRLVDCMSPGDSIPNLLRLVEGVSGQVAMRMELVIRFDYGWIVPWVRKAEGALVAIGGPDALALHTPVEVHGENLTSVADFTVRAGERVPFALSWHPSHQKPPPDIDVVAQVAAVEEWWREWSARCTYEGEWRDAVVRSLITLKALT
jgi:GH15 family glucan-1,4-alpha-glucosidase